MRRRRKRAAKHRKNICLHANTDTEYYWNCCGYVPSGERHVHVLCGCEQAKHYCRACGKMVWDTGDRFDPRNAAEVEADLAYASEEA